MEKRDVENFSFLRRQVEEIKNFEFGKWSALFLILALVFIVLAVKMTFFYTEKCNDLECFQAAMKDCDKARYVNDIEEATWSYEILGEEGDECLIDVKLLQVKSGSLGLEKLGGYGMICSFPVGVVSYPEKDLEKCHGRLKEEMQAIIIENLHKYMVDNLEEISKVLS